MVTLYKGIRTTTEVLVDINNALKKTARVQLLVKFSSKPDWENYDLWMLPGWTQGDLYRQASAKLDKLKLTKILGVFEEARFGKVTQL